MITDPRNSTAAGCDHRRCTSNDGVVIMGQDPFSEWTERLFDEPMRRAAQLIEEACDGYLLKIYRDLISVSGVW